jgi:hypothetical protein
MKTKTITTLTLMFFASLAVILVLGGCKSKKETTAVQAPQADAGEKLIEVYCSGPEYQSDKDYFRTSGIGESADQATSKKKALANAKAELAGFIQTTLKATFDNYVKSSEKNNTEEILEKYEGLSREVVNQQLNGIKVICEKMTVTKNNTYKSYVAIELSGEEISSTMNQKLSTDDKLFIDYNYEKYKETFDKEMENLKK